MKKKEAINIDLLSVSLIKLNVMGGSDIEEDEVKNEIKIIKCNEETQEFILQNVSRIYINNICKIDIEMEAELVITTKVENFSDMLKKEKDFIAKPLLSQVSLTVSFITEKLVGTPFIMPPSIWRTKEE